MGCGDATPACSLGGVWRCGCPACCNCDGPLRQKKTSTSGYITVFNLRLFLNQDVSSTITKSRCFSHTKIPGRVARPSEPPKRTLLNLRVPHSRRRRGCGFRRFTINHHSELHPSFLSLTLVRISTNIQRLANVLA